MRIASLSLTLVFVCLAASFSGCDKSGGPKGVVQRSIDAAKEGDLDGVLACYEPESRKFMEEMMEIVGRAELEQRMLSDRARRAELKVVSSEVKDERGVVVVKSTLDGKDDEHRIDVIRVAGVWYITLADKLPAADKREEYLAQIRSAKTSMDRMTTPEAQQKMQEMQERMQEMQEKMDQAPPEERERLAEEMRKLREQMSKELSVPPPPPENY